MRAAEAVALLVNFSYNRFDGGSGGGISGTGSQPGTQTSGYSIGNGGNCASECCGCGGGGGGYYGGYSSTEKAAGGGSGYVGGVSNGSMQTGVRTGNGYARITLCDGVIC